MKSYLNYQKPWAQGVKVVASKPEDLGLTHGGGTDMPDTVYGSMCPQCHKYISHIHTDTKILGTFTPNSERSHLWLSEY